MEIIEIEITNKKALKLLLDMEDMNLIKLIKKKSKLSTLRSQIKSPMNDIEISQQINSLRNEWNRDI